MKQQQTIKRHNLLRDRIYYRAKELYKDGVRDYVAQACQQIAEETGYSWRTLWDIYYKAGE